MYLLLLCIFRSLGFCAMGGTMVINIDKDKSSDSSRGGYEDNTPVSISGLLEGMIEGRK